MRKPIRTERKIRGLCDLSKKQRVIFKQFLKANKLKFSTALLASWLDGVQYGKFGHKWKH